MYSLIVTIIMLHSGVMTTSVVPNFNTLNTCTTAGTQLIGRQVTGLKTYGYSYDISALCVKQ